MCNLSSKYKLKKLQVRVEIPMCLCLYLCLCRSLLISVFVLPTSLQFVGFPSTVFSGAGMRLHSPPSSNVMYVRGIPDISWLAMYVPFIPWIYNNINSNKDDMVVVMSEKRNKAEGRLRKEKKQQQKRRWISRLMMRSSCNCNKPLVLHHTLITSKTCWKHVFLISVH